MWPRAFQNSILGAKRAPLKTVLSVCIAWLYYHISEVVEWRIRTEGDGFEIRVCCRQRVLNGTVIGEMVLKLNGAVWVRPAAVSQGHLDAVEDIRAGHIGGECKHAHLLRSAHLLHLCTRHMHSHVRSKKNL